MPRACPNCGADLPEELGQHAVAPVGSQVECPACGETVTFDRPGAPDAGDVPSDDVRRSSRSVGGEAGAPESFSGEETVRGVMSELEAKPGGPDEVDVPGGPESDR
jgi:hypothetical protein